MCDHCRTVVDYNVTINGVVPAFSDFKFLLNQLQHDLKPPGEHDREHIAHISSLLAQQNVQKEEWSQFVHFMENKYTRHLVAHDENFTVLLLCWNRNQRSPIHDHSGSSCWVRVLEGTITERRFMTNGDGNGGLTEIGSADVSAGGVCYINDSQGLHEMANNQADGCVVTLHVYSPPLVSPRVYDTTTGASTTVDFFRAVAPPQEILGLPTFAHPTPSSTPTVALVDFRRLLDRPVVDEAALAKGFDALSTQQSEWSSFITFSDFGLQDVIVHQGSSGYSLQLICALPGQKLHRRYRKTHRRIRVLLGEATLSSRSHSAIVVGPSEFQGTCMAKQPDIFNHSGDYLIALLLTRRVVPQTNRSPLPPRGVTSSQESQQSNDGSSLASTSRMLGTSANSENSILQLAPILTDFLAAHSSPFAALVDELNSVFCRANPISDEEEGDDDRTVHVNELLENTRLEADDLNAYWDAVESNGYRFTLYDGADFVLTLNLWEPGHRSLAHDHDSAVSWVRVIEGALIDTSFDRSSNGALKLVRNSTMSAEDVCFFGRTAIHSLKNKSPVFRAASLHLYVGGGRQAKTYETSRPLNMQSIPGSSRLWHAYEHPFAQDEFAASALPCRPSTDDVHQHSRGASMWDVALPA